MLAQAAILLSSVAAPAKAPPQLCPPPHHTRWSWSAGEIALGGTFVLAVDIDRKQTIAERAAGIKETNVLLGRTPSAGKLNTYAISFVLVGLGTATVIPRGPWRIAFLAFNVGAGIATIERSVRLGFPIRI